MPVNIDIYGQTNRGLNAPEKTGANADPYEPENPAYQSNSKVGSRFRVEEGVAQYTWRNGKKAGLTANDIERKTIKGWRGEYNRNNIAQIIADPFSVRQDEVEVVRRKRRVKARYISSNASNGAKTKNNWVIYVKLAMAYRNRLSPEKMKYPEAISDEILQAMFHARDDEGNDLPVPPHHYMLFFNGDLQNEFRLLMRNLPANANGQRPVNLFDMDNPPLPGYVGNFREIFNQTWTDAYQDAFMVTHLPPGAEDLHYWPFRYCDNNTDPERCQTGVDWNEWLTNYKPIPGGGPVGGPGGGPGGGGGGGPGDGSGGGGGGGGGGGVFGLSDDSLQQQVDALGLQLDGDGNDDDNDFFSDFATIMNSNSPPKKVPSPPKKGPSPSKKVPSSSIITVPIPQGISAKSPPKSDSKQRRENSEYLLRIRNMHDEMADAAAKLSPPNPEIVRAVQTFYDELQNTQGLPVDQYAEFLRDIDQRMSDFMVQNLFAAFALAPPDMAPIVVDDGPSNAQRLTSLAATPVRVSPPKTKSPPKILNTPKVSTPVTALRTGSSLSSSGGTRKTISPVSPLRIPEPSRQLFFVGKNKPKDTSAATKAYFEGFLNQPPPKKRSSPKSSVNPLDNLQSLRKTKSNSRVLFTPDSSESSGSSKKRKSEIDMFYQPFLTPTPPRVSPASSKSSSNKRVRLSFTNESEEYQPDETNVSEYSASPMKPEVLSFLRGQDSIATRTKGNNVRPAPINYSPGVRQVKPRGPYNKSSLALKATNRFPLRKKVKDPIESQAVGAPVVSSSTLPRRSPTVTTRSGRVSKKKKLSPYNYK